MKILYLITKSNWGGAQKYVYDLAYAFKKSGNDIVVGVGGRDTLFQKLKDAGISVYGLDNLQRDISLLKEIKSAGEMYKLVKKEKPRILHVNSSKAGGLGALVGRLCSVPTIIFTVHGAPFREERPWWQRKVLYILTWITCLLSTCIITVSRADEWDIARMFFIKKKVITIYNGINLDTVTHEKREKTEHTHVVSIGDLTKNKGHIYGIQAVEKVYKKGISISYNIEGEGELRNMLETYIEKNNLQNVVTLMGRTLTTKDTLHLYDIFLMPSLKEGLPYTLLEAGKAMMPVIATITGGTNEIIRHESTGLLTDVKDVDAMAYALERLAKNRHLGKQLGNALHSHVVEHFSDGKMIAETARVYGLL